jgi:hypothetical protein
MILVKVGIESKLSVFTAMYSWLSCLLCVTWASLKCYHLRPIAYEDMSVSSHVFSFTYCNVGEMESTGNLFPVSLSILRFRH